MSNAVHQYISKQISTINNMQLHEIQIQNQCFQSCIFSQRHFTWNASSDLLSATARVQVSDAYRKMKWGKKYSNKMGWAEMESKWVE